jgi:hypothetical protein
MESRQLRRLGWRDLIVLTAILVLGLLNVPFPFHGDQALYLQGAQAIHEGKVLYRDFWDLTNPGLFAYYLVGGTLFGFTEKGIPLFELATLLAFSAILQVTQKGRYQSPWISSSAPLFSIGAYYAMAGHWHLTRTELLIALPLYLAAWFASRETDSDRGAALGWAFSGAMGGIALLFKLFYAPILAGFWLSGLIHAARRGDGAAGAVRRCLALAAGLSAVVVPFVLYFARHDSLTVTLRTLFVYPIHIARDFPPPPRERLVDGLAWFTSAVVPLLAPAVLGGYAALARRFDKLIWDLVLWVVMGLALIVMQRMWWQYHYLLILIPLGTLAALGVDLVWARLKQAGSPFTTWRGGLAALGAAGLLFLPLANTAARKAAHLVRDEFALTPIGRRAFQDTFNPSYPRVRQEIAFLDRPDCPHGEIFVFGDPLIYYLSGRRQAIASGGYSIHGYIPEQWSRLLLELKSARPNVIALSADYRPVIQERAPEVLAWIEAEYDTPETIDRYTWFVLKGETDALRGR